MDHSLTRAQVVDLLRYRQERTTSDGEPRHPRLAPVTPFKPLSARQVEHRTRMLRHMREVTSQKDEVKSGGLQLLTFDF